MGRKHHDTNNEPSTVETTGPEDSAFPASEAAAAMQDAPATPAAQVTKSAATQSIEDLSKAFTSAKRIIKKIEALPAEARKLIRDAIAKIEV